ncbi:MAG: peptidoglycan bridge formation glycyltransferase FemA/FemB family protein [Chloroflexi bacterium]|nr:peptidoglycan bridge formation glycyltransferase FemA/FemB family protein [Chloroflexota bacterium]
MGADPMTAAWDARVRSARRPTYLQTSAWARVKAPNGWQPRRIVAGSDADVGPDAAIGDLATPAAQVLVRPLPIVPWSLGYAPRGPSVEPWTPASAERWTERLRAGTGLEGVGLLRMDPELEATDEAGAVADRLRALGWRRAHDAQPRATRVIDLRTDEAALWSGVRKKWRQYVNHARGAGIAVRDVDADAEPGAFDRFGAIMRETSRRAGIPIRATSAYRDLWAAFRPTGEARLLFAEDPAGETLAVLLLVRCGRRVTEPYGGMTGAGADVRANYLLKWEALRRSRDAGAEEYDLWGLPTAGIAHFKEGFGGREVTYVGAWDLDLHSLGGPLVRTAEAARRSYLGLRRRGRAAAHEDGGG